MTTETFDENDRDLVANAKQDPRAFGQLYRKYYEQLYRYCYYRLNRRKEVTEDVVAEVFLKALEHIKDYRHKGAPFVVWLYRIARNLIIDKAKKTSSQEELSSKNVEVLPSGEDFSKAFEEKELLARITSLIESLPDDQNEVVTLKFVSGLSFKEIGKIVGIGANAAKMRYYRAIKHIREMVNMSTKPEVKTKNSGSLEDSDNQLQP